MISLDKIKAAADRLSGVIHRTELSQSTTFSQLSGNQIYLKPENLQKTGSFKIRGAYNKLATLTTEEKERGVIASSAGNHAQGVAFAATEAGLESVIVMPENAPISKITATKNYGAKVVLKGAVYDEAHEEAVSRQQKEGFTFLPPFNDQQVIAGQGTLGLEIIEDLPEADIILVPVGGGGLISGIAAAVKQLAPEVKVVGVEPEGAAAMKKSLEQGKIASLIETETIADGIAVKKPGELTYNLCQEYVDQVVTVTDEEIANAILMLLERAKLTVEAAGAASLAAALNNKLGVKNQNIVSVLSGGNIDVNMIARLIERGLNKAGRRIKFKTVLKDRPGRLEQLLGLVADLGANVLTINHDHYKAKVPIDRAEVELELETRNHDHAEEIYSQLVEAGYEIIGSDS